MTTRPKYTIVQSWYPPHKRQCLRTANVLGPKSDRSHNNCSDSSTDSQERRIRFVQLFYSAFAASFCRSLLPAVRCSVHTYGTPGELRAKCLKCRNISLPSVVHAQFLKGLFFHLPSLPPSPLFPISYFGLSATCSSRKTDNMTTLHATEYNVCAEKVLLFSSSFEPPLRPPLRLPLCRS